MEELRFEVVVQENRGRIENALGFGDFELGEGSVCYPQTKIRSFYYDLISGQPFPLKLVTAGIRTMSVLVGVALFLYRDLAIHPALPNLLAAAELVDRFSYAGMAHVDPDLGRFFLFLEEYLPSELDRVEQETRLVSAVTWIREYVLEGSLPQLPHEPPEPRIIAPGNDGFVMADTGSWRDLELGWVHLYRQGFLRGVLFGLERNDRHMVLAARKSASVAFDLLKAASLLNEAEQAMGELPEWRADELWLHAPEEGTLLLPSMILQVLFRV